MRDTRLYKLQAKTRSLKIKSSSDGPFRNGKWAGPGISTSLSADSFHGLFNNNKEPHCQKSSPNSRYGLDETGNKKQTRHKHHQANSLKQVAQGIAPRRVPLQRKVRGQLASDNGSRSSSGAEVLVLKSALTEVGRTGKDTDAKGTGTLDIPSTNTSHNMISNYKESSIVECSANKNNVASGNKIKLLVHHPDSSKTACGVASKPQGTGSRRIWLEKKSLGQSMSKKRELCGVAEAHGCKAAMTVGRENGAATTRVNGGLWSTEFVEEIEKRLAALQLAGKTQAEASHNWEGKQKQIPSMMTVQAEERCKEIGG